jgi:hypothetical protein
VERISEENLMPLAAIPALVWGGIAAGGAAAAEGAISGHAATKAADKQEAAANHAADLNYKASQDALNFTKQQYGDQQANLAPWLQAGKGGLANLQYLLGVPGQQASQAPAGGNPGLGIPAQPVGPARFSNQPGAQVSAQPTGPNGNGYGANAQIPARAAVGGVPSGGVQSAPSAPQQASLVNPSLGSYGSLMQPYGQTFSAPTGLTEQNDPGYQARLSLGTDALQRSAAARGGVLTGGTAKALDTYAQDYASNEYNNVYNRALNTFGTNYNQYNTDQANQYNRLAALAGVGQQTAGQLATLGNQASQNVSSNLLGTAQNMGQDYQNAAAASASGYVGAGNAWNGALSGVGSNLSNLMLLKQLQGGYSGGINQSII